MWSTADSGANRSPIPVETDHLQSGLRTRDNPAGVGSSLLLQLRRVAVLLLAACGKSRRFWLDQIDRVSYT